MWLRIVTAAAGLAEKQMRNESNLRALEELRAAHNGLRTGSAELQRELSLAQAREAAVEARLAELRASHEALVAAHAATVREIEAVTDRLRA